jgi:hypothetical protein
MVIWRIAQNTLNDSRPSGNGTTKKVSEPADAGEGRHHSIEMRLGSGRQQFVVLAQTLPGVEPSKSAFDSLNANDKNGRAPTC